MSDQAALARLLVERLGRHRPRFLNERQTVLVIRRIIKHALADPSGCCLWSGNVNNDHYGRMSIWLHGERRSEYVHRLVYKLAHDPRDLPHWMHVGHSCDVPPCFHPEHVRAERRKANQQRAARNTNSKKLRLRAFWTDRMAA